MVTPGAAGASDLKGIGGMFGLFGGKKSAHPVTTVAAQVGAQLQKQARMPDQLAAPVVPSHPECQTAELRGHAPDGKWTGEQISGETQPVFIVPAGASEPALAILGDSKARMQVWELSSDKPARFVKQRPVTLDANQGSWLMYFPVAASCLPGQQVALSVSHTAPIMKEALYIYSRAGNQFRRIGIIEPEMSGPPPFSSFETLAAAPDARLVLYRTGVIRLNAGNYAYQYDHILLFSARHPQGIEIVKLGIDGGNVRTWAMQGKTLWLQTHDKRQQPKDFSWSLDLSRVL
jgi:hypothetical protein